MVKYILFILGIIAVFLVVRKIKEGFQNTAVNLYFDLNTSNVPQFIKSSDPRVTYVPFNSTLDISKKVGIAQISINPSLGPLKGFSAQGNIQNKWTTVSVDTGATGIRLTQTAGLATKVVHNNNYTRPMQAATEMKLPQALTNISISGLQLSNFGAVVSDANNGNAKILITLTF